MKRPKLEANRTGGWRRLRGSAALFLLVGFVAFGEPPATIDARQTATSAAATPGPPRTLGDLIDRVAVAWGGVRTYRSRTEVLAAADDGATPPGAGSGTAVTIEEEVVLPDRKRLVGRVGGEVGLEYVAIGGRVYARLGGAAGVWTEIDPAALDPTSQIGTVVADLAAPVTPPFANYPRLARALPLEPAGEAEVEGRSCVAYRVAIPNVGEAVEATLAIDADELPCRSETRARGITTVITYLAYNEPIAIEAPIVATPVAASGSEDRP